MVSGKRKIHLDLLTKEFTLDQIVFPPAKIPNFEPSEVDTSVNLTANIKLKCPIIGSPMDTVTESEMAILLAKMGGIGVIHCGLPIEDQVAEVEKVRRFEAGFVLNPAVLGPNATIADVISESEKRGFSSYPVTEDGTLNTKILGIVTAQDVRDKKEPQFANLSVQKVMTEKKDLVYAKKELTLDKNDIRAANALIRQNSLDTLPILNKEGKVVALVTRSDIDKDVKYPNATKDNNKQLKVLAAVESRFLPASERITALAKTGISGIVIDSRNIYGDYLKIAKFAKKQNPNLDVIIGNIVHPSVLTQVLKEAKGLIDAFRVGIGTGEVCITTEDLGLGRAMGSALLDLDLAYQKSGGDKKNGFIGFIPDGGIKSPRHFIAGAILHKNFAGVMIGSRFAGFDQSPAEKRQIREGTYVKRVRGMGSIGAIRDRAGSSRYGVDLVNPTKRYAEGNEKDVPAVGDGEDQIEMFFAGVRTAMHALGAKNISELYQNAIIYPAVKPESKGSL